MDEKTAHSPKEEEEMRQLMEHFSPNGDGQNSLQYGPLMTSKQGVVQYGRKSVSRPWKVLQ